MNFHVNLTTCHIMYPLSRKCSLTFNLNNLLKNYQIGIWNIISFLVWTLDSSSIIIYEIVLSISITRATFSFKLHNSLKTRPIFLWLYYVSCGFVYKSVMHLLCSVMKEYQFNLSIKFNCNLHENPHWKS